MKLVFATNNQHKLDEVQKITDKSIVSIDKMTEGKSKDLMSV